MTLLSTRRTVLAAALTFATTGAAIGQTGAPALRFTPAAFEAAQTAGQSILIEVSAPWCPTCKVQAPIVKALLARPDMKGLVLIMVDFDRQRDVLRRLNVRQQGTLIAYRGKAETARSTGDTTAAGIEKLMRSAL